MCVCVGVHTGFWWGNLRQRDHLEDPDIDGGILSCIFRKWDERTWTGSEQGQLVSSCECSNEPGGSIKCGVFLD